LQAAFTRLGVATELAECCLKTAPGQCFVGYEKSDLLWRGKKIAGAAQRRSRAGLLIQGSVQPPPGAGARTDWERAMVVAGEELCSANWLAVAVSLPAITERAEELAREKYLQGAHNRRR
jgi:lipoate-protein ligase A